MNLIIPFRSIKYLPPSISLKLVILPKQPILCSDGIIDFSSLIDFGCGKGIFLKQMEELYPKIKLVGFDPGVAEYTNVEKVPCELLISCDVLEHVEPDHVDNTLREIDTLFTKFAYFKIANYVAKAVLPDGRNAHLIQEDENWWRKKIEKNMPTSNIVKCYLHQHRKKRKKDVIVILKK